MLLKEHCNDHETKGLYPLRKSDACCAVLIAILSLGCFILSCRPIGSVPNSVRTKYSEAYNHLLLFYREYGLSSIPNSERMRDENTGPKVIDRGIFSIGYKPASRRFVLFYDPFFFSSAFSGKEYAFNVDSSTKVVADVIRNKRKDESFFSVQWSPQGDYLLGLANRKEKPIAPSDDNKSRFEYYYDLDIYDASGNVTNVATNIESLGEIHPRDRKVLIVDTNNMINILDIDTRQTTPVVSGERPYWNSSCERVRYVKVRFYTEYYENCWSPLVEGDKKTEYEIDLSTKEERKIGPTGDKRAWSLDREKLARVFGDSTFYGYEYANVTIEDKDGGNQTIICTGVAYPSSIIWTK